MNKSKIKKLMWWSVISLAILIFVSVSLSQEFPIAVLSVIFYCALPTIFIGLAQSELMKSDVKSIEEFDAQQELDQYIKNTKKENRKKWWKKNKKKVIIISGIVFTLALIIYIDFTYFGIFFEIFGI